MSAPQFTPGPWKVEEWRNGALYVGYGRADRDGIDGILCAWPDVADYTFKRQGQMRANARLIAAAPTLFNAANAAFDFLGGVDGAAEVRDELLAAILAASGMGARERYQERGTA